MASADDFDKESHARNDRRVKDRLIKWFAKTGYRAIENTHKEGHWDLAVYAESDVVKAYTQAELDALIAEGLKTNIRIDMILADKLPAELVEWYVEGGVKEGWADVPFLTQFTKPLVHIEGRKLEGCLGCDRKTGKPDKRVLVSDKLQMVYLNNPLTRMVTASASKIRYHVIQPEQIDVTRRAASTDIIANVPFDLWEESVIGGSDGNSAECPF